jgi:polyhydroxyalkanoate synthesis regulator phasin
MGQIGEYIGESADVIAQKTGIPKQDVENMLGTLGVGVGAKLPSPKTSVLKLQEQFDNRFPKTAQAPSAKPTMSGVGAAEANLQNRVQVALTEAPDYLKESLKNTPIEKLATEENIKVIENHNKFAKYGLVPTEGQALENTSLMSNEFNARKTDPNLQARFEERDPKLIQGFNTIKEKVSPDVFDNDPIRLASMPLDKLKNDYINDQANIRALYEKANRAAGGSQAPIDIGALRENIINGLKEKQRTRYVPARLQADLDEVLAQGFMTPEQYENFRTDTATIARTSKDPLEAQAASIIREKLEQVPIKDEFAQYKPLYDEARKAVAALKAKEKNPAYKAAISDTRTPDEIEAGIPHPAANNFVAKHYASNTPQVNIERMLDLIGRNSPEHQALNKLKIDEFKLNSGIRNDKGTVSQANLNKIIYEQNKSNLPVMFDNMTVKDLQDLADVANLSEPRKGVHSVNVSNTEILRQENAAKAAKEAAGNIAAGLTETAINMKVPFGGTILRSTLGGMKAERQAKAAAKAAQEESEKRLSPKAGIKLKDIGKE